MLGIYLNDHLAAATGALDLARRAAGSNDRSEYGSFLSRLVEEIEQDRRSLLCIMRALETRTDRLKMLTAWGAEKLGRLKLNGRIVGYSPLSRVVELETLLLGVRGKLALWGSLEELGRPELDDRQLRELAARAERQLEELESYRLRAVTEAMAHQP